MILPVTHANGRTKDGNIYGATTFATGLKIHF